MKVVLRKKNNKYKKVELYNNECQLNACNNVVASCGGGSIGNGVVTCGVLKLFHCK